MFKTLLLGVCYMNSIEVFMNAQKTFTIIHNDKQTKSFGKKENNKIELSEKVVCNDIIIEDETQNQYIVKEVSIKPEIYPGFYPDCPYIALITFKTSPVTLKNVSNSVIIINSNLSAEIELLPKEVQPVAQDLVQTLVEYLNNKTKPKNFKEKFADFIKNYGSSLAAVGQLGLQVLLTVL